MRNAAGQKIDDQKAVIPDEIVVVVNVKIERQRALAEYIRPKDFYANKYVIHRFTLQRNDFEPNPAYHSLLAEKPLCGLPHEHSMDYIEMFKCL